MSDYRPDTLGEVDEARIVDLRRPEVKRISRANWLDGFDFVSATDEEVRRIADLWRRLPHATQMRCHLPPFGLRLLRKGEVVVEATVCWQCNNVCGRAGATEIGFEFDGTAAPSQELLALLKSKFD